MADSVTCVQGHSVFITDRGGAQRLFQPVDLTSVEWNRTRDAMSEANISIYGSACTRQASMLAKIEPHRHEMVVFRGLERVWEGPINRVGWFPDHVEINAQDIMAYLYARPLSVPWNNAGSAITQATTRVSNIVNYELTNSMSYATASGTKTVPGWEQLTPPINVLPYVDIRHFAGEAQTTISTRPFDTTVGDHIDSLAHTGGIDYTVVGRRLVVWDVSNPLSTVRELTEADFYGQPIVTAYGADHATVAFVVASDGTYGGSGDGDDYYGPWAKVYTMNDEGTDSTPSQSALNSAADRNLAGRNPVPVEVRIPDSSGIRLTRGLTIDSLVPGVYAPLRATLNARQMVQMQKFHSIKVTETGDQGENIAVTLVPATAPDTGA